MIESEAQAPSPVSTPSESENEQRPGQPSQAPLKQACPRKQAAQPVPVREKRLDTLLSIGHYRAPRQWRTPATNEVASYSQIGKWPPPRPIQPHRPSSKPQQKA